MALIDSLRKLTEAAVHPPVMDKYRGMDTRRVVEVRDLNELLRDYHRLDKMAREHYQAFVQENLQLRNVCHEQAQQIKALQDKLTETFAHANPPR